MSRKSRQRMTAGTQRPVTGHASPPGLRHPAQLPRVRPAVLIRKLENAPVDERPGILAWLREEGSQRALWLAGELEHRWEAAQ